MKDELLDKHIDSDESTHNQDEMWLNNFRMNFYILEAIYFNLIKYVNIAYGYSIKNDAESKEFFYKNVMGSNRTDYSKYRNGSCEKTMITNKMKNIISNSCPELIEPLVNYELIKIGDISEKWVRNNIDNAPKEIKKYCSDQTDNFAKNVVRIYINKEKEEVEDIHRIGIWILKIILNEKVISSNAEAKIEAKLKEIESVTPNDINICSIEKLSRYCERIGIIYERFKTINQYKEIMNKNISK